MAQTNRELQHLKVYGESEGRTNQRQRWLSILDFIETQSRVTGRTTRMCKELYDHLADTDDPAIVVVNSLNDTRLILRGLIKVSPGGYGTLSEEWRQRIHFCTVTGQGMDTHGLNPRAKVFEDHYAFTSRLRRFIEEM